MGRTRCPQSHTDIKSVCLKDSGGGMYPDKTNQKKRRTKQLLVCTYNVQTLINNERLLQLEEELSSIKWDIMGLAEGRRRGEALMQIKSGHYLYHIGKEDESVGGVGFLINKSIAPNITTYKGISDRVAYIILRLNRKTTLKIIQVYAPTTKHDDEIVDSFYEDITTAIMESTTNYVIVMGEFNSKLGKKQQGENKVGNYGYDRQNERGNSSIIL